jgi:hypothetical protein
MAENEFHLFLNYQVLYLLVNTICSYAQIRGRELIECGRTRLCKPRYGLEKEIWFVEKSYCWEWKNLQNTSGFLKNQVRNGERFGVEQR